MDKLLEALGITPGPWKGQMNYAPYEYDYCEVEIPGGPILNFPNAHRNKGNSKAIAKVPELINKMIKGIDTYEKYFGTLAHYDSVYERKQLIEEITGKPWEEIKGLLDG